LQDLREMVAFEQTRVQAAGSGDPIVSSSPSDSQTTNMSWELHAFRKQYGEPANLALRWFKDALEKLLVHFDAGTCGFVENPHPVAAQAASYRACMRSVIQKQLLLLQGCDAHT
jgi:hypothetical protein